MKFHISQGWAYDFATARESESPPGVERTMDLFNNTQGRNIGGVVRYAENLAGNVNHRLRMGDLWIVRGGVNGRVVPSDQPWP